MKEEKNTKQFSSNMLRAVGMLDQAAQTAQVELVWEIKNLVAQLSQSNIVQMDSNEIMRKQCEELRRRNEMLQEENKKQKKHLGISTIGATVAWIVSTTIAILAILV